jgi:thioredoxin-dependent peroxiredoxin
VAVYAASCDSAEVNTKFAQSLSLDYPILSDPTKETAKAYGVLTDRGYADRWTFIIGKDGTILDVMKDVSPRTHGRDLAAKLVELGVPKR